MNKQYVVKSGGYETTISAYNMQDARIRAKTAGYVGKGAKFTVTQVKRKNPTKAQKRAKAQKASVQRRVAVALAKFLKQANPAMKTAGAQVQRLKGGVLKITPIKANAGDKGSMYGLVHRGQKLAAYSNREAARLARTSVFGHLKGVKLVRVKR
jgi:hypothetical protein